MEFDSFMYFTSSFLSRYKEKGGYCVITKDYSGRVLSKTSFDKKHKWIKSAYYDNGNTAKAQYLFEYEDGAVIMYKYDKAELCYIKYPLNANFFNKT